MDFVRLTTRNAHLYLNYPIFFKTRDEYIVKKILGINKKSIKIDYPDLNNNLEIVSRQVYVIIE